MAIEDRVSQIETSVQLHEQKFLFLQTQLVNHIKQETASLNEIKEMITTHDRRNSERTSEATKQLENSIQTAQEVAKLTFQTKDDATKDRVLLTRVDARLSSLRWAIPFWVGTITTVLGLIKYFS